MKKRTGARLGQHFLIHSWAAAKLAHAVAARPGETILEIGPGKGVLTKELLALGNVVAVEKDPALVARLQETFADELATKRLTLVEQDIRNFDPGSSQLAAHSYVIAANIPYYITGEIIRQFLSAQHQPRAMALLVQKEVADRIIARNRKESILSISVKAYGTPRIIAKVSRSHFSPPPRVDSAILLIDEISKRFFSDISEEHFFALVRAGFASKRKLVANNLSAAFGKKAATQVTASADIDPTTRAENLALEDWKRIAIEARRWRS